MIGRDIYIKRVDPAGKDKTVITQHRVWDGQLFLESLIEQYDGPKTKPEDRRLVSIASRDEYEEARR